MLRLFLIAVSIVILSSSSLLAQPEIKAIFTETAPVIDGSVYEDIWSRASLINELYQREPKPGDPVSENT
jgi:hypothetical protein